MKKTKNQISLILVFSAVLILTSSVAINNCKYIKPTGTYKFGKVLKNEKQQEYFGETQVVALTENKIIVSFFLCKGAPSFNQGSFIDTLEYNNNQANYIINSNGKSICEINFKFTNKNLIIKENINRIDCDFGNGIFVNCTMNKTSSSKPIIKDLSK